MRCPNCQTMNAPTAKFCLECGNRLVICPNCGTVNVPLAKFCIECGTALARKGDITRPLPSPPTGSPASPLAYPSSNGNENRLLPPEERRVVTIMFADIIGSTPLADRLDPEDMRAILTGYFNLMTEQIRRHGGTVEKYIGDAVMAVFGAPVAHEDDPDRAIRAALDMQKALEDFNQQRQKEYAEATHLQMRIGINTGEVAAPGNTQSARQDFLITGDAVNVAARLQQVAAPDTILVGERSYLATREVFDFRPIAPLHLKGKPEPIPAWVVIDLRKHSSAVTQHPRGIAGLQAPLIGRSLELTLMHATYARVQAEQHPHLITLLGAPGIGKSRLAREFIVREQDVAKKASSSSGLLASKVLEGHCPPYGEGITYWPLLEILRSILNVQDGEDASTLSARFAEFVRDTLTKARRTEEPEQIASAIARSIGWEFSGSADEKSDPDRRERERLRKEDLGKIASTISASSSAISAAIGRAASGNLDEQGYVDRWEREPQRSKYSKDIEQSSQRIVLFRAWRVLLEALAELQPLILLIDDLQWADQALLDLLEYLTERITNVPILFLCPARPDFFERRRSWGGGRRNFTTIALESLSAQESSDLVDALLNTDDLPEVLRHTILSRAEGNPFFVEEIVRMLVDQGVLIRTKEGCWRIGDQNEALLSELASPAAPPEDTIIDQHYVFPLPRVPDTVQGVLAARIDLLSNVEKRVVQHASIIGRTFWLSALLELAADLTNDAVLHALDSLVQHDFIVEAEEQGRSPVEQDRVFSFKHILIRDVAYNNIPRMRRSQEHARLALWLEEKTAGNSEAFVELLAYHYQQALVSWSAPFLSSTGDVPGPAVTPVRLTRVELRSRTITYLTMAGDQAFHSYHTIRAIQAYSEALDLLTASEADKLTLAEMHRKLGDAYTQRANFDEAWQEYRQALQLVKADESEMESPDLSSLYDRLAELGARWLHLFNTLPDMQEVRSYICAGLKLLEAQQTSAEYAAFLTYQAIWYMRQVELRIVPSSQRAELAEQALQSGKEALRIAKELNDTYSLWISLDALVFIHFERRQFQEAHEVQQHRLELTTKINNRGELHDFYVSLGWVHERVGDYPTALKWLGFSWQIAQTMESPSMLLASMIGRMYAWYQWNRWSEVREVASNILQMAEQYQQDEQWYFDALETLAEIAYRTGNEEEGDQYMRQSKRLIDQHNIQPKLTRSIHLAREDWARAATDYSEAVQLSEPFPQPMVLAILAELYVMVGESAETQQTTCERAVTIAEQSGSRKSLAIALRGRGRMHLEQQNWTEAEQDLRQALHQCEILDLPWEKGQTLYCLGLFYRRRADALNQNNPEARVADLDWARHHFEQALGFFEALKAVPDAERVRLALVQDGKARV